MAGGRVHAASSVAAGSGILAGYVVSLYGGPVAVLHTAIGCAVIGVALTPDHDVDSGNITHHYNRKLLGTDLFWRLFWLPYATSFKHRSFWSHAPIVGTLIRWLYLVFPSLTLILRDQYDNRFHYVLVAQVLALIPICAILLYVHLFGTYSLGLVFIGSCLSDLVHWLMD